MLLYYMICTDYEGWMPQSAQITECRLGLREKEGAGNVMAR